MAITTDEIFELGDDQASSQYSISFPDKIPNSENTAGLVLRLRGAFKIPTESWYTYDVFYKGMKVPKKGMLQETEKMITVEIRLDQQWKVYDDLRAWAQLSYNQNTGESQGDYNTRIDLLFTAENTKQEAVRTIRFKKCGIKSMDISEFNYETGDPTYITVELIFNEFVPE